jgi:transposase InsO family protein
MELLLSHVIIDIFSRRIVAWCIADAESAALFKPLFDDAVVKHNVADRGGPMKAKATALMLADLGVTKSHSRPYTSNDNPFSESHFKTLKYLSFLSGSAASRTQRRSAVASSIGIIRIITMLASA